MDMDTALGAEGRRRLDAAIDAREDGEPDLSAEMFQALAEEFPDDAEIALEYALTLRKLERGADADAVLDRAMARHPENFELRKSWWQIPGMEVNYDGTLERGRVLRRLFDPRQDPRSWDTLAVELDCYYEMGAWERLADAVRLYWDDLIAHQEIFPHGIAALQKLFLNDELARLMEQARPEAWGRLPAEAGPQLRARTLMARENAALVAKAGAAVISIGQNCLPYQLAGRWGFVSPLADPAELTPFDLGGFTNDSAADAIETEFAAFEDRANFVVSKAWGGGKMYLHRPSQVGFFHERGTHWVTPDGGRFFSRLALMIANWKLRLRAKKRLFVFCYCGAGRLDRLVQAAAATLLGPGAHLLIIDVLGTGQLSVRHPQVTYLRRPYPAQYDWTSVFEQSGARGFEFELGIAEAISQCLGRLDEDVAAPAPAPAGLAISRRELVDSVWSFGNRNGNLIAPEFGFDGDGRIAFYQNGNESRWRLENGALEIFKDSGALMWRSESMFVDAAGRWHVVLRTHLDPGLEFVLAQLGARAPADVPALRYTGRMRVLVLDNGLGVAARLRKSLDGAEIVHIDRVEQIDEHAECNIFVSGLVLSHMADPAAASALAGRIAMRFSLAVFFEISGQGREYLNSLGLRSFHRDFADNPGIDALDLDFFAAAMRAANVYKIEHYADQPAYDSFKPFVVSAAHAKGTMPRQESRGDYRVFDRPVFEIAAFACHKFDSLDPALDRDLILLDARSLKFRPQASGVRLDNMKQPGELGPMLYSTARDADPALKARPVTAPAVLWDEAVYAASGQDAAIADWCGRFAHEMVEVRVFALPNCLVSGVGAVFSNGVFVAGTDYLLIYLCSSRLDPIFAGMQRRHERRHVTGTAILAFNGLYDNYYHFVGEAATSLSLSLDVLGRDPAEKLTVVTGKLNGFRRQHLEILLKDRPAVEIVELGRDEFVTADELIYCDNLGPTKPQNIVVERVAFMDRMIAHCGLQDVAGARLIYLARTDSAGRRVVNEAELIERLRGMGFEIFVATGKDVAEQIATFRSARMVVAAHGAGLTNIMFARPETIVLELVQASYLNTGMMRLAQTAQARYYSEMFFETLGGDQSWAVDVERVCRTVGMLLEK
jgi:hypothetical protein